jgi:hypothetical protein
MRFNFWCIKTCACALAMVHNFLDCINVENHVKNTWFSTLTLSEILQVSRFDNQKTDFNLNAQFSNLNQPLRCGNNNIFAAPAYRLAGLFF